MERERLLFRITVTLLVGLCLTNTAGVAHARQESSAEKSVPASAISPSHIREIVSYHNKVRRDVGVGPLKWSPRLARFAQGWAEQLASTTCRMKHRSGHKYGENLFIGTAGHFRAVHAAQAWEQEKPFYKGGVLTKTNWKPAGHYTQMIWRDTERVGCGEAQCRGMLMVVCNYDPPGNYIGEKPY